MAAASKRLVIDASVAAAAGLTIKPASRRCREFLLAVLKISHRLAMTPPLATEWDAHQSLFAARWRADMRSRGKTVSLTIVPNEGLRSQVPATAAIRKDLHLIEAALATDNIVISLDDSACASFRVDAAKEVVWVNPVAEGGHALYWLNKGAGNVEEWKLGYQA